MASCMKAPASTEAPLCAASILAQAMSYRSTTCPVSISGKESQYSTTRLSSSRTKITSGSFTIWNHSSCSRLSAYPDEGWGLTNNGSRLIMSDGTANLYFLNPQTFQRTGYVAVHDGATPIDNLNELEYINGSVFANVWLTNRIAVINPGTGQVTAWIDLTGIENLTGCHCDVTNDVLNGIAYDAQSNHLFVTGKMWPSLFEIQVVPPLPPLAQSPQLSGYSLCFMGSTVCFGLRLTACREYSERHTNLVWNKSTG